MFLLPDISNQLVLNLDLYISKQRTTIVAATEKHITLSFSLLSFVMHQITMMPSSTFSKSLLFFINRFFKSIKSNKSSVPTNFKKPD